jgi:hypothetical protein
MIILNNRLSEKAITYSTAVSDFLVIPAVIIRSGVLNGLMYTEELLSKNPSDWNGVPTPVYHTQVAGRPESARSPEFESSVVIGRLYNTKFQDGKLVGEIWIEIGKAVKLGFGHIVEWFKENNMMEISTGLYPVILKKDGVHENKEYYGVVTEMRPDHVALLPDEVGACSIKDGCGALRANSAEPCCKACECKKNAIDKDSITGNDRDLEVKKMNENIKAPASDSVDKASKVAKIIENSAIFEKDDLEVLQTLPDSLIDKLSKVDSHDKEADNNDAENADNDDIVNPGAVSTEPKADEMVAMNRKDYELFNLLKRREQDKQDKNKALVLKHYKSLDKSMVNNMDFTVLEALAHEIKPKADYTGSIGSSVVENSRTKTYKKPAVFGATRGSK